MEREAAGSHPCGPDGPGGRITFSGRLGLFAVAATGEVAAHPVSHAHCRRRGRAPATVPVPEGEAIVGVTRLRRSLAVATRTADGRRLLVRVHGERGRLRREPSAELELSLQRAVTSAPGRLQPLIVRPRGGLLLDAAGVVHRWTEEPAGPPRRGEAVAAWTGVAAWWPGPTGLLAAVREEGWWRLACLEGTPAGPPIAVPEAGRSAWFGPPGVGSLPWGLSALERSDGSFLLAAGSRLQVIVRPPGAERVAGVVRAKGRHGEPALLVVAADGSRLRLLGPTGSRDLPTASSAVVQAVLDDRAPLCAQLAADGELVVRALTGPGDRRLYRWRG